MKDNGFSLLELLAVMAIIGILLAVAALNFSGMSRKYAIDNQTRSLYTDLMNVRVKSMYSKKSHFISLNTATFIVYSSGTRTLPVGEVLRRNFIYPVLWNGSGSLIEFDSRGLTDDSRSICVSRNEPASAVDSIVISKARINMGKRKTGRDCGADYIDIK